MILVCKEFETLQGEPEKSVAADDDGKDGSHKTEDIAVSLEHVEEHVKGADESTGDVSCLKVYFYLFSHVEKKS